MIFSFLKDSGLRKKVTRIFKFGTVGVSGVAVNSGFLYLLTENYDLDYKLSSIVAIELSIINNYFWNSFWTWSDKKTNGLKPFLNRFMKFQVSTAFIAVINYVILVGCTELLHIPYMYSNLIGILIGSTLNFLVGHFWIFRDTTESEDLGVSGEE